MNDREFIKNYVDKILSDGLKNFPAEFLSTNDLRKFKMPCKALHLGEEFFGNYEILTSEGESFQQVKNYIEAKYIIYSNRDLPAEILMPEDDEKIKQAVKSYESYLDKIVKEIDSAIPKTSLKIKNPAIVISEIFRILNLIRY